MRSNLLRRLIQVLIILPFPSWEMLREKPLMYIRMTFSIGVDLKIGSFFMFSPFFYGDTVDVVGCIGKREQGNKHKYILCSRQQSYHGSRLCIHALVFYFCFSYDTLLSTYEFRIQQNCSLSRKSFSNLINMRLC